MQAQPNQFPASDWRPGRAQLCPDISDFNLFSYCQGIVDLDAEIPDRAFDLGMPEQELDGPEIARPPIDQGSFSAAQRMRPEQPRVQSNAADPLGDEPGILAGGHTAVGAAMAGEQELARPFAGGLQIIINCLTGLIAQIQILPA